MKYILGKKVNMTQIWQNDICIPVTLVQAGPCVVVQIRKKDKDGYEAVQVGFGEKKEKNIRKPQLGHNKKVQILNPENKINLRFLKEFRSSRDEIKKDLNIGDIINVNTFEIGDIVDVTSVSKGKGFQGVVKRHGFAGSKKTHGNKDQLRMPGSIGATGPAHVFKGTRMGGRTGGDQVTTKNLEIVKIDQENNLLYVKGAVSGARNTLVMIKGDGDLKIGKDVVPVEIEIAKNEEEVVIKE